MNKTKKDSILLWEGLTKTEIGTEKWDAAVTNICKCEAALKLSNG